MTTIVYDIETIPDPRIPYCGDGFPPAPHHQIVAIGCLELRGHEPQRLGILGGDEAQQLATFAKLLGRRPRVVGWNTRGFDFPVIQARAMVHAVPMPAYWSGRPVDYRYRYQRNAHLDLSDWISDHGAAQRASLNVTAKSLGLPGKTDTTGADVAELWAAGEHDRVRAYCLQDVVTTALVLLRFELVTGDLTPEQHHASWERMLDFARAESVPGFAGSLDQHDGEAA
jgi:predicted PolB exonuclease-like 3'-5' exonuclease